MHIKNCDGVLNKIAMLCMEVAVGKKRMNSWNKNYEQKIDVANSYCKLAIDFFIKIAMLLW